VSGDDLVASSTSVSSSNQVPAEQDYQHGWATLTQEIATGANVQHFMLPEPMSL
jgi:hypothetical protein